MCQSIVTKTFSSTIINKVYSLLFKTTLNRKLGVFSHYSLDRKSFATFKVVICVHRGRMWGLNAVVEENCRHHLKKVPPLPLYFQLRKKEVFIKRWFSLTANPTMHKNTVRTAGDLSRGWYRSPFEQNKRNASPISISCSRGSAGPQRLVLSVWLTDPVLN